MFGFEGFLIGFFGGAHCIGMCGPIALALPMSRQGNAAKISGGIFYNLGRATTYLLLGLIFGLVGAGFKMSGIQQWVSIAAGAIMILSVLIPMISGSRTITVKQDFLGFMKIKKALSKLIGNPKGHAVFLTGVLNGFLPCGLVYIALGGALVSSSVMESGWFMFMFGLGTLPYLFALIYFGNTIKGKLFESLRNFIPIFIILLGILFILRGLNLGIPYISPAFGAEGGMVKSCCQ